MSSAFIHLVPLLRDIGHARAMRLGDWDDTLRLARQARLLGLIAHRLADCEPLWAELPTAVRGHCRAAINHGAHRQHMISIELRALDAALPPELPVILLKGAAYVAQGMPFARGRLPNDVDLLVARTDLDAAEAALLAKGWAFEKVDAYDQRYYREWSHELPPMRFPGHALELDLHHTIAPVTSRSRADDRALFDAARPLPDSRYRVLGAQDQIIHAAIHLFQDSDLDGRLRDLADLDGLIRFHLKSEVDWRLLLERTARHRASRAIWYAMHYCAAWLGTPVPPLAKPMPPSVPVRAGMDWLLRRALLPRLPDRAPGVGVRVARRLGQARYHCLRMPPLLLSRHLLHKSWAAATRRRASVAA